MTPELNTVVIGTGIVVVASPSGVLQIFFFVSGSVLFNRHVGSTL